VKKFRDIVPLSLKSPVDLLPKKGSNYGLCGIKVTVARDFTALVFYISKVSILGPDSYPNFFQIWFQIRRVVRI
jgi:hypothetical protein